MPDPRRLGKRGAYRLGELRGVAPAPGRPRAPHAPSFRARRRRAPWLLGCAAAAALLGLGAAFGLWWLPFPAGLAAGLGPWRPRVALGLAVLATAVGWGAALWWPALWFSEQGGAPAGATARVIAALAGLPPHAWAGVAATLLLGAALAATGVWLAQAAKTLS